MASADSPHGASRASDPSAVDATIDFGNGVPGAGPSGTFSSPTGGHQPVAVVEGSGTHVSSETQALLRSRLRASAMLLFIGSFAFLIWGFFNQASEEHPLDHEYDYLWYFHLAFVIVEGACAALLVSHARISLRQLRLFELVIFGLPAVFFWVITRMGLIIAAHETSQVEAVAAVLGSLQYWTVLMIVYAMYIPNTWRRAAGVVLPLAAAPVVIFLAQRSRHPVIAEAIPIELIITTALVMALIALICIYGAHTIHRLRLEAIEAKQLGQYRLRQMLGAGGMGEVYLAEHQLLKRPCAIKLIRPGQAADPRAITRFEREVKATAKLSHWNTVEIFDYGRTDDGTFYYVMEFLPGLSVAELVKQYGPLSPHRAVHLLRQTCDALAEAHAAGLIHRDIKPGNLFSAQRGGVYDVAKLLDFGLVKNAPTIRQAALDITQEGAITGSPLYMSPEQAIGGGVPDARSDIYSLGAVAYYMLTGHAPFEGDQPMAVLIAHARDEVTPPSQLQSAIPGDLEQIVLRCLAKRPEGRYTSAEELEVALATCSVANLWSKAHARQWWTANGRQESPEALEPEAV